MNTATRSVFALGVVGVGIAVEALGNLYWGLFPQETAPMSLAGLAVITGYAVVLFGLVSLIMESRRQRTEHELLEVRLARSEEMATIGELAGGVAHDVSNLLNLVTSYTEYAVGGLSQGSPAREDLQEVVRAMDQSGSLVRELLAVVETEHGRSVHVPLNDLILRMKGLIKRSLLPSISLEMNLTAADTTIFVLPGRIERVLLNLSMNARTAMPAGGRLTLTTFIETVSEGVLEPIGLMDGHYVTLRVADTGSGMTREVQRRMFQSFFTNQIPAVHATNLGLDTAHRIVQEIGGMITMRSDVDTGTTFTIRLPLASGRIDS